MLITSRMKTSVEIFETVIEGRSFLIQANSDLGGYGFVAYVPGMAEPESPAQAHSMKSTEDAILQLVEKLQEAILENRI